MVSPIQIAYDIAGTVVLYGLVPLLWVVLFLVAWEDGPFARSLGFGPRTFWLLVPGVIIAFFAELPFAQFDADYLGINIGGGLIPLVLSCYLFARFAPPRTRTLLAFLGLFGVECGIALAVVLLVPNPAAQSFGVVATAAAATLVATVLPSRLGYDRAVAALVGLSSGVLTVTFLITTATPDLGITAPFPADLVAPVAAGAIAVLLAPYLFGDAGAARSIPLAYAAGTFGVIMGADLLRQPPLYGSGAAGFYVIGGANFLDLVYLSGLLAFATAYLAYRSTGLSREPVVRPDDEPPRAPTRLLGEAIRLQFAGNPSASIRQSSAAARAAAEQSRRLRGGADPPADRPWEGLPVPGWVVADQANLDALAASGSTDPGEADRAAQMSRMLVGLGRYLNVPCFGSVPARLLAFLIDLLILIAPATVIGLVLLGGIPSSSSPVANLQVVTASYGFIAVGFLYFVIFDLLTGTSPGKRIVGLEVRERGGERPGVLGSFVRESPKLLDLTAIGVLGPLFLAVATGRTVSFAGVMLAGPAYSLVVLGLVGFVFLLTGVTAVVAIGTSSDRQRLGDRMAGTLVLRRARPGAVTPQPAAVPSGASGS